MNIVSCYLHHLAKALWYGSGNVVDIPFPARTGCKMSCMKMGVAGHITFCKMLTSSPNENVAPVVVADVCSSWKSYLATEGMLSLLTYDLVIVHQATLLRRQPRNNKHVYHTEKQSRHPGLLTKVPQGIVKGMPCHSSCELFCMFSGTCLGQSLMDQISGLKIR